MKNESMPVGRVSTGGQFQNCTARREKARTRRSGCDSLSREFVHGWGLVRTENSCVGGESEWMDDLTRPCPSGGR